MARRESEAEPKTPFQKWLLPALEKRGIDLADLSRMVDADYPHLWKLAKGDPQKYPTSRRPGYELTRAIGEALGDIEGALNAAGYTAEPRIIRSGDKIHLQTGDVITFLGPNGEEGEVVLTADLLDFLNTYAAGKKARNQQ